MAVVHIGVIRLIMVMVAQVDRAGARQVIAMVIQDVAVRARLAKAMQAVAVKVNTMQVVVVVPEAQVDQDEVMEVLTVV
jgi:CTP-dependent riboflavin kinase